LKLKIRFWLDLLMFKSAVDYPLMVKISLHIFPKAMTKMIVPPNDIWTFSD